MLAAGLILALALIIAAAFYSRRTVRSGDAKISSYLVTGLVLGTFVGGSCTVGTAQLAYVMGFSALWYCLGGAVGCIVLAVAFSERFRRARCPTIVGILTKTYGPRVGIASTLLNSVGTFLNVLSQLIAGTAVLAVLLPDLPLWIYLASTAAVMFVYVAFGGTKGAGLAGLLKLALLYGSMIVCAALVLRNAGGWSGFVGLAADLSAETGVDFLDLFGRGVGKDVGACVAVIIGLATTQIYAQAVMAAESAASARKGLLAGAVMLPILGLAGTAVGIWMRANFPGIPAKTALTEFILTQLPAFPAGVMLGALFITVVGTGAGLTLGIATVLRNDLLRPLLTRPGETKAPASLQTKALTQALIGSVLAAAALVCLGIGSDMILFFAFLSMALRGAGIFAPLCSILFGHLTAKASQALAAVLAGPVVVTTLHALGLNRLDPLFFGILVSFALLYCGGRERTVRHKA